MSTNSMLSTLLKFMDVMEKLEKIEKKNAIESALLQRKER